MGGEPTNARLSVLLLSLALLLAFGFLFFVWPTPYTYLQIPDNPFVVLQLNRLTHTVTILSPSGRTSAPNATEYETRLLRADELKAIYVDQSESDCDFQLGGKCHVRIYNGTPKELEAVQVSVGYFGPADPGYRPQGWRPINIRPYEWAVLTTTVSNADAPTDSEFVTMGVVRIDAAAYKR